MNHYYLFARPSFLTGIASIIDFGNTLFVYNDSPTGEVADYIAIKNDWFVVGEDLQEAVDAYTAPDQQLELLPSGVG
jgi:hypothetical protein